MTEDQYLDFCNLHIKEFQGPELVLEGDWGLSIIFVEEIKDRLKLIDAKCNGYLYNEKTRLWQKICVEYMYNLISETLGPILKEIVSKSEQSDKIRGTKRANVYRPVLARVLTTFGACGILKQAIPRLVDRSFITQLDRTSTLLPLNDGKVINLKTLEVRQREAGDYFSFECPVNFTPRDEYPIAEEFFMGICKDDKEYVDYLRRLLAYFMTGEISDRHFYIFVGSGMNGKSTLIKLMQIILGDFYKGLSEAVMIGQDKTSNSTPELVPLLSARMGVLPENRENVKLHGERLKAFTGDDSLVCRPLYMEEFNFMTQSKLVLMTNTLPSFNGSDKAMTDRVIVLPFYAVFPNNPTYKDRLIKNIDEIFSYIIVKSTEFWATRKVDNIPAVIKEEINAYSKDNDVVGLFIGDRCELVYGAKERARDLYNAYTQWSEENRLPVLDKNKFFSNIEKRFMKQKTSAAMVYNGLRLVANE
jgi:putative DNA primase/helicase